MITIDVSIAKQELRLYQDNETIKVYRVSTAKNGTGEIVGSGQTPRGMHIIRAKIGQGCPMNTVFKGRRPTGEIYTPLLKERYPERDWILTRVLWLSGLEVGKNRLGSVDTMRRYIYIHGSPDETVMGVPYSKGCIRMHNQDMVELFDSVTFRTPITINE